MDQHLLPVRYLLEEVWEELFRFFRDYGYLRRPRVDLWPGRSQGARDWEVRFLLDSTAQRRELQALLAHAGYDAGQTVRRHGKRMHALYGPQAVALVEELWDHFEPRRRPAAPGVNRAAADG
jgi:hypothetical protein